MESSICSVLDFPFFGECRFWSVDWLIGLCVQQCWKASTMKFKYFLGCVSMNFFKILSWDSLITLLFISFYYLFLKILMKAVILLNKELKEKARTEENKEAYKEHIMIEWIKNRKVLEKEKGKFEIFRNKMELHPVP